MDIGNNIKKVRELRNYTQQYMAEMLSMTPAGYSKIERDEVNLTIDKLEKISDILKVSPKNLLEFDERIFFQNATFNGNYNGMINHGTMTVNERIFEDRLVALEDRVSKLEGDK